MSSIEKHSFEKNFQQKKEGIPQMPIDQIDILQIAKENGSVIADNKEASANDITAEEEVLSSLINGDSQEDCVYFINNLDADLFTQHNNKILYLALIEYYKNSEFSPGYKNVIVYLQTLGNLEEIGGTERIVYLKNILGFNLAEKLVKRLQQVQYKKKLQTILSELQIGISDVSSDIGIYLKNAKMSIDLLAEEFIREEAPHSKSLGEIITEVLPSLADGGLTKYKTGFLDIDIATNGGFESKDLIVIGGRASMGKSNILVELAYNFYALNKKPVLYITLEMGYSQLAIRFLKRYLIDSTNNYSLVDKIDSEALDPSDLDLVVNSIQEPGRIEIAEWVDSDISNLEDDILRTSKRYKENVGLVVIDYVGLVSAQTKNFAQLNRNSNRTQEMSAITKHCKQMAKKYDCPIVLASQINRNVENRADKRPALSDLRESGSLEQDADQVWLLYRDGYYNPESPEKDVLEINLAKLRNRGKTGIVKMLVEPQCSRTKPIKFFK